MTSTTQPDELESLITDMQVHTELAHGNQPIIDRIAEEFEARVRQWALGVAPERKYVNSFTPGTSANSFNEAIDEYKRNLRGE